MLMNMVKRKRNVSPRVLEFKTGGQPLVFMTVTKPRKNSSENHP